MTTVRSKKLDSQNSFLVYHFKSLKLVQNSAMNEKIPDLCTLTYFSWASNCFVGPPSISKIIALEIIPFELCEIAWFPWQQIMQQIMRFKTVSYIPTNYLYLSRKIIHKY